MMFDALSPLRRGPRSTLTALASVLVASALGCGGAPPPHEESAGEQRATTPSERAADDAPREEADPTPTPERAQVAPRTAVLDDWAELEPALHAVYHGVFSTRTTGAGMNELCIAPDAILYGSGPMPSSLCTPIVEIAGFTVSWPPLATSGEGVAASVRANGRELLLAAVRPDACADEDCRASFREALWPQIHCADLSRHFEQMRQQDASCARDDECLGLTAMCFDSAVRADRAEPHLLVLRTYGGVCLHPAAGACVPTRMHAACVDGRCVSQRTP
ncbi:MAG: hypothetical protein M3Y87_33735 [Myxococcota bacterium]|nr:hypothetical protein [Myxococcota bacterium]